MREINGKTRTLGLLGDPVEHTLSPLIHNTLSELLGKDMVYVPFHVTADELGTAVSGAYALNISGLNVTVPHKTNVMQYLNGVDDGGRAIGAVNTLVRTEDGYTGYNTDMLGLYRAICSYGIRLDEKQVILLGAGGAAKAVAYMCAAYGVSHVYILNRTVEKAQTIATHMNEIFKKPVMTAMSLDDYQKLPEKRYIVFQSTSKGLYPNSAEAVIEDPAFYRMVEVGIDLVYKPFCTRFMTLCMEAGSPAYNGLKMLLYQGVIAYELWNEIKVDEDAAAFVYQKLMKEARDNIILTGFMGSGKTTVGQTFAKTYGYEFLDTDRYIEAQADCTIAEIFDRHGEAYFRRLETETLQRFNKTLTHTVISTGGGLPLREENASELSKLGTVVYLRITPEEVLKRLAGDTSRPLLRGDNPEQKVRELLASRAPFYERTADLTLDVAGKAPEELAAALKK